MLTQKQIEQRFSYLTGSDTGTICGVNPWATPVELWQYKTRRAIAKDVSDKPAVIAGNMLEDAVTKWFEIETGKEVVKDDKFYVHRDIPFLGGNIDGFIVGENAILECKTTQSDKGWGAGYLQGDNKIPDSYLCQVIHYLAVTNREMAYVAVLIRGIDFRWFRYERNYELEDAVINKQIKFWNDHIIADIPPTPQTADEVKLLLQGKISPEAVTASADISFMLEELRLVRADIDLLKDKEEELVNKICVYMGDKQTLLNTDNTVAVTWKQRPGTITFDSKKFKKDNPDLYQKYQKQGKEVRSFLLK
jgi:putative phage-type endonuclease